MDGYFLVLFITLILMWGAFGALGALLGKSLRNQQTAGAVLGVLLGPIGLCFIPVLEDRRSFCKACRSPVDELATICPKCRSPVLPQAQTAPAQMVGPAGFRWPFVAGVALLVLFLFVAGYGISTWTPGAGIGTAGSMEVEWERARSDVLSKRIPEPKRSMKPLPLEQQVMGRLLMGSEPSTQDVGECMYLDNVQIAGVDTYSQFSSISFANVGDGFVEPRAWPMAFTCSNELARLLSDGVRFDGSVNTRIICQYLGWRPAINKCLAEVYKVQFYDRVGNHFNEINEHGIRELTNEEADRLDNFWSGRPVLRELMATSVYWQFKTQAEKDDYVRKSLPTMDQAISAQKLSLRLQAALPLSPIWESQSRAEQAAYIGNRFENFDAPGSFDLVEREIRDLEDTKKKYTELRTLMAKSEYWGLRTQAERDEFVQKSLPTVSRAMSQEKLRLRLEAALLLSPIWKNRSPAERAEYVGKRFENFNAPGNAFRVEREIQRREEEKESYKEE